MKRLRKLGKVKVTILKVIGYYDGPTLFIGQMNGSKWLFWSCTREDDGGWGYLAVPHSDELMAGLGEGGTLTQREVFGKPGTLLATWFFQDKKEYWTLEEFTEPVPEDLLCADGVSLRND